MSSTYEPPGYMTDFDAVPGMLDQWSDAVSGWFDEVIKSEEEKLAPSTSSASTTTS